MGVLAAAAGVVRDDEVRLARLAALPLGIRVDREGILERDFQTTQDVPTTMGTGHRTVVSERYYLADALFLVVLGGPEELLVELGDAVCSPRWPVFLGRRAFVPARPLFCGFRDESVDQVLREHPWLEPSERTRQAERSRQERIDLRTVVDCHPKSVGAEERYDLPLSFAQGARRFASRTVLIGHVPLTDEMITTGEMACS